MKHIKAIANACQIVGYATAYRTEEGNGLIVGQIEGKTANIDDFLHSLREGPVRNFDVAVTMVNEKTEDLSFATQFVAKVRIIRKLINDTKTV